MNNKTPLQIFTIAALCITAVFTFSCNKKFDAPPEYQEPNITPTTTIAELKAMHTVLGSFQNITTDLIISGIVVADDRSGNFYKEIVFQDATGGITIRVDGTGLFTSYPIGRKIYIKLKGLYIGDYNGRIQIGSDIDNSNPAQPSLAALPSVLMDQYIIKGSPGNVVTPVAVTAADLTTALDNKYQNTLIQLSNYEFAAADTGKTYADAVNHVTTKGIFNVGNCSASGEKLELFNSGYSNFAGFKVPSGNGTLTAVYVVFGNTKELIIRDTNDVKFSGARCTGSVTPPPAGNGTLVSIDSIRQLYMGTGIKLGAYKLSGVVVSDVANKNISSGSVILQDGDRALAVYFGGTVTYNLGDSLVLDISGDSLIKFSGGLEIKTPPGTVKPAPVATNKTVNPMVLTIADLNAALGAANLSNSIEGTVIQVVNASASPAGTFSGNKTLDDGTGTISLFTGASATFSSTTLPSGPKTWTGIATLFNTTKEIKLRSATDVF